MTTECSDKQMEFHALGRRCVRASFDGGRISSDGGGLLLREVERHTRIIERLAGCFTDHRDAGRIEHELGTLVGQRVYALALGYEDLNDHEVLRCWRCCRASAMWRVVSGGARAMSVMRWRGPARSTVWR